MRWITFSVSFDPFLDHFYNIKHNHLAPVNEMLVFTAIAALSGIIGNASYDLVKKIINKICKKCEKGKDDLAYEVLNNPKRLNIFVKYLEDYYEGLDKVNPEVRRLILEEIMVHISVEIIERNILKMTIWFQRIKMKSYLFLKRLLRRNFHQINLAKKILKGFGKS